MAYTNNEEDNTPVISAIESVYFEQRCNLTIDILAGPCAPSRYRFLTECTDVLMLSFLEKGVYQLILALAIGFLAGYAVAKAH